MNPLVATFHHKLLSRSCTQEHFSVIFSGGYNILMAMTLNTIGTYVFVANITEWGLLRLAQVMGTSIKLV